MTIFADLLNKGRTSDKTTALKSRQWFREKARQLASVNPGAIINANRDKTVTSITSGSLYLYEYDPKTKEQLPYWDRYPLVFPISPTEDGFLGLNMHYLPHSYRAVLMDRLYDLTNNKRFDQSTKLRLSYQLLSTSSRYKYFEPCLKRYLYSHVRSRLLLIPANEWDVALFLPLERFQKATKATVYGDSRRMTGKN